MGQPADGSISECEAQQRDGVTHLLPQGGMTVAPSLEDWLLVIEPARAGGARSMIERAE